MQSPRPPPHLPAPHLQGWSLVGGFGIESLGAAEAIGHTMHSPPPWATGAGVTLIAGDVRTNLVQMTVGLLRGRTGPQPTWPALEVLLWILEEARWSLQSPSPLLQDLCARDPQALPQLFPTLYWGSVSPQ